MKKNIIIYLTTFFEWLESQLLKLSFGFFAVGGIFYLIFRKWYILSKVDKTEFIPQLIALISVGGISFGIISLVQYLIFYSEKKNYLTRLTIISGIAATIVVSFLILEPPTLSKIIFAVITIFSFVVLSVKVLQPVMIEIQNDFKNKMELKDQLPIIIGLITFILGILVGS